MFAQSSCRLRDRKYIKYFRFCGGDTLMILQSPGALMSATLPVEADVQVAAPISGCHCCDQPAASNTTGRPRKKDLYMYYSLAEVCEFKPRRNVEPSAAISSHSAEQLKMSFNWGVLGEGRASPPGSQSPRHAPARSKANPSPKRAVAAAISLILCVV